MSPWEIVGVYFAVPFVAAVLVWRSRFETDGNPVPEFEAWCRSARPTIFALRCAPGRAAQVADMLRASLGPRRQVEHHRGRHPWTLYLFTVDVEADGDVVRCVIARADIRRVSQNRSDVGTIADTVIGALAPDLESIWLHAELRETDERPTGPYRRERGWLADVRNGAPGSFASTLDAPTWARARAARA